MAFAGREPILGAMWFAYVLFMAMTGLTVTAYILNRIFLREKVSQFLPFVLLLLCVIACTLTRDLDFNIPRFNNTLTVMWLIYVGYLLKNKARWSFDSPLSFAGAAIVFLHFCMTFPSGMALNGNNFADVITLTVGTVSALYVVCFISKKLQGTWMGDIIRKCGEESFYIMAFHFVGFKLAMTVSRICGYDINVGELMPPTSGNLLLLTWYLACGIIVPILLISGFRIGHRLFK